MAGAGVSGAFGDVKIASTQVSEIKKWTFNPKANVAKYSSNKTGGYKKAVAGIKEGSGTLECIWDPAIPPTTTINIGTSVTLKLYTTAAQFYSVPAVIADFSVVTDLDTGDPVGYTANFEADGAWTDPVAGLVFDAAMAQQTDPGLPAGSFTPGVLMDEQTGQAVAPVTLDRDTLLATLSRLEGMVKQLVSTSVPTVPTVPISPVPVEAAANQETPAAAPATVAETPPA